MASRDLCPHVQPALGMSQVPSASATVGIPLGGSPGGLVAVIDAVDLDLVRPFHWRVRPHHAGVFYAVADGSTFLRMHRVILGARSGEIVDHINYDGLDNRRANLRIATRSQSTAHRRSRAGSTSRFMGVSRHKHGWQAAIRCGRTSHYLGYFRLETEAALAYNAAARELHGPFATLNEIPLGEF